MANPAPGWFTLQKRKRLFLLLAALCLSTVAFFCFRGTLDSCDCRRESVAASVAVDRVRLLASDGNIEKNPLDFLRSKLVLLVSHELSLSGGPLLLMELAFLLRNVDAQVIWITYQKPVEENEVTHTLEHKLMNRGVLVL